MPVADRRSIMGGDASGRRWLKCKRNLTCCAYDLNKLLLFFRLTFGWACYGCPIEVSLLRGDCGLSWELELSAGSWGLETRVWS